MLPRLVFILAWATLVSGLALPSFAPELANAAILALMAAALLHLALVPNRSALIQNPSAWMPLVGGLLMVIALSATAKSAVHVAAALVLVHLYMVVPLAGLLGRLGKHLTLQRIGLVALLGSAGGAVVSAIDVYWFGAARAGLVNNPIHLADITLALSFIALVGLWHDGRGRWIFILGPILGIATVIMTGSRGPMLSAFPMLLVAGVAWYLSQSRADGSRRRMLVVAGFLGALVLMAYVFLSDKTPPFEFIYALLGRPGEDDESTRLRFSMYEAATNAFIASPLFGHGLIDYVSAAARYAPDPANFPIFDHLHSDIADFAVAGGSFGLVAYALFLLAPVVGGIVARGPFRLPLLYLGAVTTVGYFCMGLTNAVIGLRWLDIILATVLAIIVTLSQPPRPENDQ